MDNERTELLRSLAKATTLQEQQRLVTALSQLDSEASRKAEEDRSLDWANTAIKSRMQSVATHVMHTEQTDWMQDLSTTASADEYHNQIHAEASMWYNRVDSDVKADADEFVEQARGTARRVTGHLGDQAENAAQEFLSYVSFLHRREAASGLPQVNQNFDSHDQFAPTPIPPDQFPTFEGPVHPINEWVEGNPSVTDSHRPSRAQDVGGAESQSLPGETDPQPGADYPTPGNTGTGFNSQHTTDDANDRSQNENWPETEQSGDAAQSADPSEHNEAGNLDDTSKTSSLISHSLWDSLPSVEAAQNEDDDEQDEPTSLWHRRS